jgi:hypothetical protein
MVKRTARATNFAFPGKTAFLLSRRLANIKRVLQKKGMEV